MIKGIQLRIKGKVQGVGFRPYVWQLAHQCGLHGDVCNDGEGVLVRLLADADIPEFTRLLYLHCPPLAHIDSIQSQPHEWSQFPDSFTIRHSGAGRMDTQVIPDAATCIACQRELFEQNNHRFHYPFTNCTHCGPRFTIIRQMPYDRPNTAMADFPLCPRCLQEYDSPADRRFHAQPNACPDCGPQIKLYDKSGQILASKQMALTETVARILQGDIIAIKGLGGFHLACDATNDDAIKQLRQRKNRPTKPFAVMIPSLEWLNEQGVNVSDGLRALLNSSAAPIVLIKQWKNRQLSREIAPNLHELGIMLPSNPLQILLMDAVKHPLIMTSGNAAGKPPALTNERALTDLADIADAWLMHNRDIIQRADDSLVRYDAGQAEMMRRARGYVPDSIELPAGFEQSPSILALGADLKNTFCLLRDKNAVISQHFGDLEDMDIFQQYQNTIQLFKSIYRFTPDIIAADMHPSYISHQYAQQLSDQFNIPVVHIQHHHAHIVAAMVEHGIPLGDEKVIGLALDGLGYGDNNGLWGGECLLVNYTSSQYLGGLPAVAMPGGNMASHQPWRNLFAHLHHFVPNWQQQDIASTLAPYPYHIMQKMVDQKINSPSASSAGRLFDAVAAALGICSQETSWEGEAACQLEALALSCKDCDHPVTLPVVGQYLDLATFWQQWMDYKAPVEQRAMAFHQALAQGFADLAHQFADQYHINRIILSGGVMHNQLLRNLIIDKLQPLEVLHAHQFPMGDGGLALGQAIITAAKFIKQ